MIQWYFEDYKPGSVHKLGEVQIKEEEIIAFGRQFDPQVFHTDPEGAKETVHGGLIASGWHTASLMMRLFVNRYLSGIASVGSPGVDTLRWLCPVRPDDVLSVQVAVTETRRSRSRPDRGIVRSFIEVFNQNGELVMDMNAVNFLLCRPQE